MPIYRLQCSFGADTAFPRDRFVFTPHFNVSLPGADVQALCEDLLTGLQTWLNVTGEVAVRAYDAQGTPPVFPQGEAIINGGLSMNTTVPRELALCLSFYGTANRPRNRGRLYIPAAFLSGSIGVRPSTAQRQKVADLVPILTGLGGADVDWSIYSRADAVPRSVQNWWVDDEWDIIRSRGLRSTTRLVGTTSEG